MLLERRPVTRWHFSSLARISGESLTIHFPAASFFFFLVEISSRTPLPLFLGQDQSTMAQRTEMTVAEFFPDRLRVRSFSFIGSHTPPGQLHSKPTPTSLGQGCMRV